MSGTQLVLDLGHRPSLNAGDFLVAPCNEAAVAWIDRWPDWPSPALVIHGPEGCGKSHLVDVWRRRSGARLLEGPAVGADPRLVGGVDRAVALEGAERAADEEELLHLFNQVVAHGGSLLFAARTPPAHWATALPDLRSRLVGAPAVAIAAPDDDLLAAVLTKQFRDRQLRVGDDVLGYLVARMERSFAAAGQLVEALDKAALAERRAVTVALARQVLGQAG